MSFEVLEERVNPLLGRREAKLMIGHEGAGTPDRITVRNLAARHFKAPLERVFVKSISTRTGGSSAMCMVEVYDDAGQAEKIVPAYLKNRNLPKEQRVSRKKGEEAKPAAPPVPKPAAKPAAEKKAPEVKAAPKAEAGKETKPAPKPETGKGTKPAEAKDAKAPGKAETKPKP